MDRLASTHDVHAVVDAYRVPSGRLQIPVADPPGLRPSAMLYRPFGPGLRQFRMLDLALSKSPAGLHRLQKLRELIRVRGSTDSPRCATHAQGEWTRSTKTQTDAV